MSRRKQTAPERRNDEQDGETQQKMRKGSTSKEQQAVYHRDLRVTPERRKKLELEQQGMELEGMRETRSRRSTAGKKPMRLLDAGILHTKRQRKTSSTTSNSSAKDQTMPSLNTVDDDEKPKQVVRMRRLGVLRRISESPVKKKSLSRGRPPKMIHRLVEIEPNQDGSNNTENSSSDDVFDSPELMTGNRSGDGTEVAVEDRETTGSETADMAAPRDGDRKEITEHKSPRDINEANNSVSSNIGGSGGNPDANSCERDADETKTVQPAENGEASAEDMGDDSQAVLHDSSNSNESQRGPTGAQETATEDDITGATSQGRPASDPGDLCSIQGSGEGSLDGMAEGGSVGEGSGSDSNGLSDRWEAMEGGMSPGQFDDDSGGGGPTDMAMTSVHHSRNSKNKERRRRPMEGSDKRTCDVCMESFANSHQLTQHIRKHNSINSHNCKVCGKTLSSASSLDRHMLIHSGERPFKCTLCPMAFTTNGNMHRHMRTHEKEGVDLGDYVVRDDYSKPRKRVPSKRMLDSNEEFNTSPSKRMSMENRVVYSPVEDMKVNEGEMLNCPVCSKSFLCKYGLQTHMDLHPNLALRCSMCDSLFRNHRGLRMHIHMAHKRNTETSKDEEQIPLGFQDLSFMEFSSSKFPLVAQVWCEQNVRRCNSIEHRFICPACNKAFPCNSALDLHVKNAHSNEDNRYAGSPSSDKENELNSAMQHFAVIDKLDEVEKEECQKEFMAALQLKPVTRIKTVTPAAVTPSPGLLMVQGGPLERGLAVREYNYNQAMKVDSAVANPLLGAKARVMDFADVQQILKMTSDSGNPLSLLSHQPGMSKRSPLKGATPGAMPVGAMPGELQSARLPTLPPAPRLNPDPRGEPLSGDVATEMHIPVEDASRHRLQMTTIQPEMTNGIDDDSSSQPGSESDNESLYGLKKLKGKNHTCKYCEKTFPFASTLKVHMRSHLGLTPYKCMLCSYSSADKSTLVRHMRTHSGERPYACKLCKFPFTTKANCERHIKKRHNKEIKADIELCIEHCTFSGTGLDGKFCSPDTVCKICNRDFKFFRDLQNHLRVHERTPTKPFVCQRCQMGFTSRGNCARHIIKSHPEVGENNIEKTIVVHDVTFSDTQSIATDDSTYLDDVMSTDSPQSEPLDFSMKGSNGRTEDSDRLSCIPSPTSSIGLLNFDGPIDLSMPKLGSTVGKLRFKRVYHKFYSRLIDALVCPHCTQAFAHGSLFKQHIRSHTMERPHRCYFCSAAFTMKENLDKHIEKRHSVSTVTDRPAQAFIPKIATPMQFKLNMARTNQILRGQRSPFDQSEEEITSTPPPQQSELSVVTDLMTSLPPNLHQSPVIVNTNYNSADSSVELSSISKILANTSSSNFQNFLTPPLMTTNASPLLMTALSTNPITVSAEMGSKEVRNVPVIVKPVERKSVNQDMVFIKQEPRSNSPAVNLTSQPQPILDTNNLPESVRSEHIQDLPTEQDQAEEPIPLEKTPAGKELLRKQTCPYCFRKFPWISSLKRHILTHTGLKPYQCPQCGSSFSTKSNCERHIVRRHCGGSRETSRDNSPAVTPPNSIPPLEQLFICLECKDVAFSTKRKLEKHYETHHPTEPFPECYKKETRKLDLPGAGQRASTPSSPYLPGAGQRGSPSSAYLPGPGQRASPSSAHLPGAGQQASTPSSALDLTVKTPSAPIRARLPSYHHHHHQSSTVKEGKRLLKKAEKAAAVKMKKIAHEYGQIHEDEIIIPDSNYEYEAPANSYSNLVMKFTMKPSQHSCHMCSKRFKSSTALKRHHRVHTLEHPFQCLKCQASFTTKFNCQRHMQKLHGMSKEEVALLKECEVNRGHDLPTMVALREPGQHPLHDGIARNVSESNLTTKATEKVDSSSTNGESKKLNIADEGQTKCTETATPDSSNLIDAPLNKSADDDSTSKSEMNSNISSTTSTTGPENYDNSRNPVTSSVNVESQDNNQQQQLPTTAAPESMTSTARSQSTSPSLPARKELCTTPDGDDDDENEDIKKFKELDPDITVVNPKTPSEEGDESNNMTWTLDSNVTASPERSTYMEERSGSAYMEERSMLMNQSPDNSNDAFSTPTDMISSEMDNSDIIQNLLGIQDSSVIDQMLDTGDSQTAAKLLGVRD